MFTIRLEQISKRFQYEWIFKNISTHFEANQSYTLIGANGSGKSTLLQIIAGIISPTSGKIMYQANGQNIPIERWFKHISIATPYQELIEELTLNELVKFHLQFKKFKNLIQANDFIQILGLEKSKNKFIKHFSSGMKQRVKLGLALYSDTSLLLLDEPTTNLDKQGVEWYQQEILQNLQNRICILCSNQAHEYTFCPNIIDMMQFKT
jgi:ABC-type multidrug transport system ATPase subunit